MGYESYPTLTPHPLNPNLKFQYRMYDFGYRVVKPNSYGLYKNSLLFRGMVRNGIPRVCFYFCSTERNSELFSLLLKGSEGNSESLLLFLVRGTEFRVVFSSTEGFGTEFRKFSVPRNSAGIPSAIIICSVFSVFRGIIFLSEIPNSRGNTRW